MKRVALITGGARGLGLACAERLARDGVAIMLAGPHADGLSEAAATIDAHGAPGGTTSVDTTVVDITTQAACRSAVSATLERFGRLDILVNAAGVYPRRPVLEISADDWQHVFQVNVLGTYFMMVEAIAEMREHGRGHIVNITSIDAFKAHPANAHYAATKAAVVSLTRSLALEVAPLGILINSVAPGPMATEAAKKTDWYAPMVEQLPTRRPIEPHEVANLVAYLSHADNVSIAGENIVVSGAGVIV
jgi:3-oxoacyl-[acyl-carrier protein] reductase